MGIMPKEKAIELLDKMLLNWSCDECHNHWAKECVLIAVDEILKLDIYQSEQWYWQEVKKEIENL